MADEMAIEMLDFPTGNRNRHWALVRSEPAGQEDCMIADVVDNSVSDLLGRFEGETGNVYALQEPSEDRLPAVLNVGDVHGATGQLKVLQEHGNYLRFCRWDRLEQAPELEPEAVFRTLPQCGCGGYLGTPRFFKSFAEMSAYAFCMFYLR